MEFAQNNDTITIDAARADVWAVLVDGACLPEWATMVQHTTGGIESAGSTRHCQVTFGSRVEQVSERCVEADPGRRIAWEMASGSMLKLYKSVGFGYTLEDLADARTVVTMDYRYVTRNPATTALHRLVVARKLRSFRRELLSNLKALVERRTTTA